ncbi:MAG: hypothetical protein Q8880_05440, partial [Bacteroidota bacterium]|nr:hypothetical protein [Bacteroidota bacterium]
MKKICLLFLLITIYSGSFSQTLLNNNTEKFKEQSRKINRVEKLKFSSNFYHQKNKNKTIATSNWYDYAYMTINNNSEMYNDILFPDTNVIIPYTDYNGRPWVHSIGTLLDPTSLAFDTLGQEQINYGVPYNLDSICVHFLYNKTNKNIKDTLIIDIWKIPDFSVLSENDIFTMSRDSKSITCMNVNWDSTNYDNSKVKLPGIKDITKVTYKMVLENSDTTTGGNIGGKNLKTNMSVPAGGLIGCAVSFKPGYSYSDDDYITDHNYFQFISMKEQKNKYNDYTEGDYNCSYILPSEIRFNVFSNSIYLPSYYFSSDGNAYSTYFGKTSYPYENHLIDFLISANVPKLKLLKPTGGESIESGKNYVIQWSSEGVSNIKIEFTKDYGTTWKTIVASTSASNGSYTWTPSITDTTKTGDIKISDVSNQYLLDYTKNEILITSPSINIKSPSANDIYATNSNIIIYWESTNVNNVKIEYQTSSKSPWILITSSVSAKSQIYSWTAPSQA